jgi:hypothetical protein
MSRIVKIDHKRKGIFIMSVTAEDEDFISGVVREGSAAMISEEDRQEGDPICVRKSLCTITEVQPEKGR